MTFGITMFPEPLSLLHYNDDAKVDTGTMQQTES